jgi:hypothetical protein
MISSELFIFYFISRVVCAWQYRRLSQAQEARPCLISLGVVGRCLQIRSRFRVPLCSNLDKPPPERWEIDSAESAAGCYNKVELTACEFLLPDFSGLWQGYSSSSLEVPRHFLLGAIARPGAPRSLQGAQPARHFEDNGAADTRGPRRVYGPDARRPPRTVK